MINNMAEVRGRITAPCLLVTGEGGTGKTAIISQLPHRIKKPEGLIYLSMAEDTQIKASKNLRAELAKAMGIPITGESRTNPSFDLPQEMARVIKLRKLWGVVIDEFHDALLRNKTEQRLNMSMFKRLAGEYGIGVVAFGNEAASAALNHNNEFKRRFYEFKLKDWSETQDFRSFVYELESLIPLKKPSFLYEEKMLLTILAATNGRVDSVVDLIKKSAAFAIRSGSEAIDSETITKTIANPWSY
ncbi:TniB family NTP-binding protein [Pseudomonas sp. 3A(2025)]